VRILLIKLREPTKPTQKSTYMPPLGLWTLKTFIERDPSYTVEVADEHTGDQAALLWGTARYDLIGLSAQFSIQHAEYVRSAKRLMQSDAFVIAGGFHASAVPEPEGVKETWAGEGEPRFQRFLNLAGEPTGPTCRIPDGALERYWNLAAPHDLQSKTQRWMSLETSRGCYLDCGYCGVRRYWGAWRPVPMDRILAQLDHLCSRGVEEVFIEDDNVNAVDDHFEAVVAALRERGLWWSTPNGISAHRLLGHTKRLAPLCWRVSLPFEAGSARSAELMGLGRKWMPFDKALSLVKALRGEGILTAGFFIIGYPGETLEDMQRTLDYANALPLDQRNIYIATPYPGTRLYERCIEEGWLAKKDEQLYDALLYTVGLVNTAEFKSEQVEQLKWRDRAAALARKQNAARS